MLVGSDQSFAIPTIQGAVCVVANGILGQVLGWLLIARGLKGVSLAFSGVLMLIQPALTFLFDCTVLGRNTEWLQLVGCILLLTTVAGATWKEQERSAV